MSRAVVAVVALVASGCGDNLRPAGGGPSPDAGPVLDAPPVPPPTVQVTAPNGGEQLYPATPFTITWTGASSDSGALTYDVAVIDGGGSARSVATGLADASFAWSPSGVAAPATFKIRVTAITAEGGAASDDSDAAFTLSPPLTGTSFARDIQPIFTVGCVARNCHTHAAPTALLDLSAGYAYGQLVGVNSIETPCLSYDRVAPGQPSQSYLVFKLEGNGPCFYGVRMPKNASPLLAGDIAAIRGWITEGALDN